MASTSGTGKTSPASKLISAAAREVLAPMGLRQKGRSRIWIDDHCWWLGIVEFQPSSWSKGSYLNVAVMWPWFEQDYLAYNESVRLSEHVEFENEAQFSAAARTLAKAAAAQISEYRAEIRSIRDAARRLGARSGAPIWHDYFSGVSCGLIGDTPRARRSFDHVLKAEASQDWVQRLMVATRRLDALLDDPVGFREHVEQIVRACRAQLGLPVYPINWAI